MYVNKHLSRNNVDITSFIRQLKHGQRIHSTLTSTYNYRVLFRTNDDPEVACVVLLPDKSELDRFNGNYAIRWTMCLASHAMMIFSFVNSPGGMNDNVYEIYEKRTTFNSFSSKYSDRDPCDFDNNIDPDNNLYNYIESKCNHYIDNQFYTK